MIIGVMSDTHGRLPLMHRVANLMVNALDVEIMFHLGDDFSDAQDLGRNGHDVRMVPGLWCPEYHDGRIPNRIIETVDGVSIAAVHAEKDLRAIERAADVVLTGHTHKAALERIGASLYLNPGHLSGSSRRGGKPSFATLAIEPGALRATIHETNGSVRTTKKIKRA